VVNSDMLWRCFAQSGRKSARFCADLLLPRCPVPQQNDLIKSKKIILIGGQEVGRTGGADGLASLRRKRLLTGVHIHPKVFVMVAMDRRLVSVMMTMADEQLIKLI